MAFKSSQGGKATSPAPRSTLASYVSESPASSSLNQAETFRWPQHPLSPSASSWHQIWPRASGSRCFLDGDPLFVLLLLTLISPPPSSPPPPLARAATAARPPPPPSHHPKLEEPPAALPDSGAWDRMRSSERSERPERADTDTSGRASSPRTARAARWGLWERREGSGGFAGNDSVESQSRTTGLQRAKSGLRRVKTQLVFECCYVARNVL